MLPQQAGGTNSIVVVKDENGNTGSPSESFNPNHLDVQTAIVTFSKGSGYYAFDEWIEGYEQARLIKDKYENISGYYVPCKLLPPGRTDKVAFEVKQIGKEKLDESKIIFRSGTGTEYIAKNGEISITGGRENDAQDIYALYPDESTGGYKTLGKLKVLSYKELSFNLTLVNVKNNRVNKNEVQTYLNTVYGPLGIQWTVSEDQFSYPKEDMDSESSGLFSRETDEMKAIDSAYKATGRVDANTVYLFILRSGNIKEQNLAGDMPRGKQFGYIFTAGSGDIPRTIAHELGHGKFKLRHTFDNDYGSLKTINNLMDYSGGTHLAKWQWDVIFDPALLVSPFEGDEAGMQTENQISDLLEKARLLTAEYGNVYAIVHNFFADENQPKPMGFDQSITKPKKTEVHPIHLKVVYSPKINAYTSVLFFEFAENEAHMQTELKSYNLEEELSKILNISSNIPSLSVLVPEENQNKDCTPFLGNLDAMAKNAIRTGEFVDYYTRMLTAIEDCSQEKSLLIFANGYRMIDPMDVTFSSRLENPETKNEIHTLDIHAYWGGIDTQFIERLKPRNTVYTDGHHSIKTSNHLNMVNIAASATSSYNAMIVNPLSLHCYHNPSCVIFNTSPNVEGFNERRRGGAIAGARLLEKIRNREYSMRIDTQGKVLDKVDIVCHSMGFAYALGIIDILKQENIPLGRFYIIAPENAGVGEVSVSDWEEIWQYGSDGDNHPLWLQDGVAPQTGIRGFGRERRAFIPQNEGIPQGFIDSHKIENYEWIFTTLEKGQNGYITPME